MTTIRNNTAPSHTNPLAALRAITRESPNSLAEALDTAERQAEYLHGLFGDRAEQTPATLTDLIPTVTIERVDDLPVPGTSFWATGQWHIHLRAGDPKRMQVFTLLHQLKHIIDHPLRQRGDQYSDSEWEVLADYFAHQVLAHQGQPVTV
jgi:hypothetical protein